MENAEIVRPGETVQPECDKTYYAIWTVASYDVGQNKDVINNKSTASFITTELYDFNELFNLYSASAGSDGWYLASAGNNVALGSEKDGAAPSRGFVFVDTKSPHGSISNMWERDRANANQQVNFDPYKNYDGKIVLGLFARAEALFHNGDDAPLGVQYVGEGDYLFHYDTETGYYYYDSSKNAASYNQADGRFYVYDYIYGTSKSHEPGENESDFLPFNYMTKEDAEAGEAFSDSNGATNYFFGMKNTIDFTLADPVGEVKDDGSYGNLTSFTDKNGEYLHKLFKFSGDDVWVFVDGKLVLDMGGIHDFVYGEIDFSTGMVTTAQNGAFINKDVVCGFGYEPSQANDGSNKVTQTDLADIFDGKLEAGHHTLTFYYMERGSSQSNAAIYFNISKEEEPAPTGDLTVSKAVAGSGADTELAFPFTVVLDDETVSGTYGDELRSRCCDLRAEARREQNRHRPARGNWLYRDRDGHQGISRDSER